MPFPFAPVKRCVADALKWRFIEFLLHCGARQRMICWSI